MGLFSRIRHPKRYEYRNDDDYYDDDYYDDQNSYDDYDDWNQDEGQTENDQSDDENFIEDDNDEYDDEPEDGTDDQTTGDMDREAANYDPHDPKNMNYVDNEDTEEQADRSDEANPDDGSADDPDDYYEKRDAPSTVIGQPSIMEIIGPSWWSTDDLMQEEFVMRENMRNRTYGIAAYVPPSGYPRRLDTNVFQELLAQGNVDVTLDIVPRTRRETMKELSNQLTILRANAEFQNSQGQTFQLRENIAKFNDIDNLLDQIQFDENRLYDVVISLIVYGTSERDLNRNFGTAADLLANEGISITPYAKRVKSGYLQTIPIGARMYNLDDTYRNVDRKSLAVMDLARNASGRFNGGIPIGVNQATPSQNTEFLNVFGTNTHRPINYNMGIVGESGGGKSTANKLKMAREISILGFEHRSIDPDGEYVLLAKNLDQLNLTITPDAHFVINPCAISVSETPLEEEVMTDDNGRPMTDEEIEEAIRYSNDGRQIITHEDGSKYVQKVPISQSINNVERFVNLVLSSSGEKTGLTVSEKRRLEDAMNQVIKDFGITSDPDSLYLHESGMINGQYYDRKPKPEPTLSDIYKTLIEQNKDEDGNEDPKVTRLLDGLKPYLRTGSKPIFDGQTFFGKGRTATLNEYKYVNFNISQLTGDFQKVAYYVITQYLWEQWMNNPAKALEKKVLDMDEILQFIDDDFMFDFVETMVRRDRKRNGSLTWLTQDIERLKDNKKAKALVSNSEFMLLLATKPEHRKLMKNAIDLTDGALDILTNNPEPGEGILRQEGESIWIRTNPQPYEMNFAESNRAVEAARKRKDALDKINKMINQ